MKVVKFYIGKKVKYMEVIKVASVQFDSRPDWVLVQDVDVPQYKKELFWIHPMDTKIEWVREFSFKGA
jgi:hypothetical protein